MTITNVRETLNKGTVNEKKALNGINLHLSPGDFVMVIGGNGVGKSTVFNIATGVYPIDCGKIEIDGVNISREPGHRRTKYIGRVFRDPMKETTAGMGIQKNLALAFRCGQIRGLGWGIKSSKEEFYHDSLAKLGLGFQTRMSSRVGLLFGRQRQALTLLMATLGRLKLLLLDEYTAALDPETAKKVLGLTKEIINEQSLTALIVTHNMKDAIQMGNRLAMMRDGGIICDMAGEEKKELQVDGLLEKFGETNDEEFADDRMMLAK